MHDTRYKHVLSHIKTLSVISRQKNQAAHLRHLFPNKFDQNIQGIQVHTQAHAHARAHAHVCIHTHMHTYTDLEKGLIAVRAHRHGLLPPPSAGVHAAFPPLPQAPPAHMQEV